MTTSKRTVLITGCSDGGMGAALALEFQTAGLNVIATARDVQKMASLADKPGIRLMPLDISSTASIKECIGQVDSLDILVNNAGLSRNLPMTDYDLDTCRHIFETNVFANLAMIQATLPLLMKSSRPVIVNHTSVGAHIVVPFQSAYNASKAAMSMFSDSMRIELAPFDIAVVQLKTGMVRTNIVTNTVNATGKLPENSIYSPARAEAEEVCALSYATNSPATTAAQWAKEVVPDILAKNPPPNIWRGKSSSLVRITSMMPFGAFDNYAIKLTGLDKVYAKIRAHRAKKTSS